MAGALGAYRWLATHGAEADEFAGKWVAVIEGKIVAAADSLKKLLALPDVKSLDNPLLTKIPRPEEAYSLL